RWFIIVGSLLAVVVGVLVYFKFVFLPNLFKEIFSKPQPPASVSIAEAKSEVVPNLLTAVGDLAAVHQVNVTSDVSGRITDIMFTAGASVKEGSPLVQLFDGPEQGDLASSDRNRRSMPRRPLTIRPSPAFPRPRHLFRKNSCVRRSMANSAFVGSN